MKHTSWLSGLRAVRSPRASASARTSALVNSPTGSRVRQLGLAEDVKDVALVLGGIGAARQAPGPVGAGDDASVVAGGNRRVPDRLGPAQKPVELQVAVALDARVRRGAAAVGVDVRVDDVAVEVFGAG